MVRLKKVVYKNRVRVKDFLSDFDRLRTGSMHENYFITGLSIAGLDKSLSPQQIGTIVDAYRVQVTPSLSMIDWVSFVEDVERIFTVKVRGDQTLQHVHTALSCRLNGKCSGWVTRRAYCCVKLNDGARWLPPVPMPQAHRSS